MLFHQLSQHLVLLLELGFQEGNALLAGLDLFVRPFSKNCFNQR